MASRKPGANLRWTEEQFAEMQRRRGYASAPPPPAAAQAGEPAPKPRKYRNVPTVVEGVRFDSKHEAECYRQLREREQAGEIAQLRRQVPFAMVVNGELICTYIADFTYMLGPVRCVADAKSAITRKDPLYRVKRKLLAALHQVDVIEL